jgi:GT2 family glycosyltransferase
MIVRRRAFEQVDGFDEHLEASEDVDLCQRLRAAGWQLIADERLKSTHYGDPLTLGALFRAERWRGRNNIQVSVRNGLTWRDLPSVLAPVIGIAAALVLAISPLLVWAFGVRALWAIAGVLAASLVLPTLTAIRMMMRARAIGAAPQALAVAFVYHAARAAALVAPGRHHRQ